MPSAPRVSALTIHPSGAPGSPTNEQYGEGFLGMPKIEALVPYADTFIPIGGVEARTRLTFQTALEASVYPTTQGTYVCGKLSGTRSEAPPVPVGSIVAVEFRGPDGKGQVFHTTSGSEGYFCGFFNPKVAQPWSVQASFAGDTLFAASESAPVSVP